jgi:hypothetical protein
MKAQLGRLALVSVREIWECEASDFTPWLAQEENIALLSEVVGIPLVIEAQEHPLGIFRADIVARDHHGQYVLIENQLEKSDHGHLGQLLTYASGLQAASVIWITPTFTDEHRGVISWLNEITLSSLQFFGVQIELWRIGESDIAPRFSMVSGPHTKSRQIASARISKQSEAEAPRECPLDESDVLARYPLISEIWLAKGVKSVSVEEITAATGFSRQRIVYHAKKSFARTPKNRGKYTVASVLKWLKTAPVPAGKTGETPPVSLTNGHAKTTMPLEELDLVRV